MLPQVMECLFQATAYNYPETISLPPGELSDTVTVGFFTQTFTHEDFFFRL